MKSLTGLIISRFILFGTLVVIVLFTTLSQAAYTKIPTSISTCNKSREKCATLSLVTNSRDDVKLCDSDISNIGKYNFVISYRWCKAACVKLILGQERGVCLE